MKIIIGSARVDERGKYSGGYAGDQKQKTSTNDTVGEVSMQDFYVHKKGWTIMRPKSYKDAKKIAKNMKTACNNKNIGYDQGNRLGVIEHGVNSKVKTEADCGSLVRECVKEATGKDPGNFNTENEVSALKKTGLFKDPISYSSGTTLYEGDVLVTKTKGHTVIVVEGKSREEKSTNNKNTTNKVSSDRTEFIKEVQKAIGAKVDGVAGPETLGKTITISRTRNRSHSAVKAVQKYLNKIGYSCGTVDGLAGIKFDSAVKRFQKANGCVVDGEITAGGKTWRKLLGI